MLPVRVNNKKKKEKYPKDEFPKAKFGVQSISKVRKRRYELNKDFELLVYKLKTQYYDKEREEYNGIKILEDGVFSSVMEMELFFSHYRGLLYWS